MEFDWNRKRQVQVMTPNKIIQTASLSPKEVIATGGNRIQLEQVIASLCAATLELIKVQEDSAERITKMYERLGDRNARTGDHGNTSAGEQRTNEVGEGGTT